MFWRLNIKNISIIKLYSLYFLSLGRNKFYKFLINNHKSSNSQMFQDLFVIFYTNFKKKGFFIEIGVGDGIHLSNSYLLENKYSWEGLLCEADYRMFNKFYHHRKKSELIKTMVSDVCKKNVTFYLAQDPYLSSPHNVSHSDQVTLPNSKCLNHILEENSLNIEIDYISIDTEGTEFEILKNFDFRKYKVKIITVEHNFDFKKRKKINELLISKGYTTIHKHLSHMDDWYIL